MTDLKQKIGALLAHEGRLPKTESFDLRLETFYRETTPAGVAGWRVELDPARKADRDHATIASTVVRAGLVPEGTPFRVARVISPHHGGETRGYVIVDEEGTRRAYLRGACQSGGWTEMDRAVAAALDCTVVPYAITAGGVVSYPIPASGEGRPGTIGGTGGWHAPEGYEADPEVCPCPDGPYCNDPECHAEAARRRAAREG